MGGGELIFRMRADGGDLASHYSKKRQEMINFIGVILGAFITTMEMKEEGSEFIPKEMLEWEEKMVPINARKKAQDFMKYVPDNKTTTLENPIVLQDLQICVDKFLKEESLIPGVGSGQLRNLILKLNKFEPEAGRDKKASDRFNLYEKKVGMIFSYFGLFVKDNIAYLMEQKNHTRGLDTHDSDSDDGPRKKNKEDENKIGVEAKYNLHNHINNLRDMYIEFFSTYPNLKEAKTDLLKLYNIYLMADSETSKTSDGELMLLGKNIPLTPEETSSLSLLIDTSYLSDGYKSLIRGKDPVTDKLEELLMQRDSEVSNIIGDFFTMLVKCNYQLKVKDSPYFNNFDLFKTIKVMDLKDFVRGIESTRLIRDEYSEFPLLKDYSLTEVLEFEKNAKHDKAGFANSLAQKVEYQPNSARNREKLDPRLVEYLNLIIKLREPVEGLVDKEIIEGINRQTVTKEDIKLCLEIMKITQKGPSEKEILREFSPICDLLNWKPGVRVLDMDESYARLERAFNTLLNSEHRYREDKTEHRILNSVRVANLWKLIKNTHLEIMMMNDESTSYNPHIMGDNQGETTSWGTKCMEFRGIKIPKVEEVYNKFRVKVFNVSLTITSRALDKGTFEYNGQVFNVDLKGVQSAYESLTRGKHLSEIDEEMRLIHAIEGVDTRFTPDSFRDWLSPENGKSKSKKQDSVRGGREEGLMPKEYFQDMKIDTEGNNDDEFDLFF